MTGEVIAWIAAVVAGLGLAWLLWLVTRNWGRWRFLPGCLVLAWSLTPYRFDGEHEAPAFAVVIFRAFLEEGLDPEPPLIALGAVSSGVVVVYLVVVGVLTLVAPGARKIRRP
ncbi:MAG: hypothetical protein OXH09_10380 [Gammaproteobacteria bacterium]|nr:hypothetical protein [Gammaproteobacteria bacterium]